MRLGFIMMKDCNKRSTGGLLNGCPTKSRFGPSRQRHDLSLATQPNPALPQTMKSNEKSLRGATPKNDDVHQLRGVRLKGLKRDPGYFLGNCKVEPAHLEECFDADTLFYDVFFEPTNRHLVAVGPPLGNLQIDLKIYVNGEPIKHSVIERAAKNLHLLRGRVSRVEKLNGILIQANGQQWELDVPENNSGTGHQFTLCTLQRDNKEHWIRDWIKHYRKMGVDRVILFDNNSEKLPDVDAIVIPCPYKYGLSKYMSLYGRRVNKTAFLHRSLLTICGYKYRSNYLLNFDVDELLQVKNLDKYKGRKLVYFDSYSVETKVDGKLPRDYSFRHFVYRNAHKRDSAYKYMVKMDALLYSRDPHYATLKGKFPPRRRVILKLQRINSYLQVKLPKKLISKMALQGEDVFYHYNGISTAWKVDRSSYDNAKEVVKIEHPHL